MIDHLILEGSDQTANGKWNVLVDSGEDNHLAFRNRGTGEVPITLKADGKVGIGTTSPSAQLHVNGSLGVGALIVTPFSSALTDIPGSTFGTQIVGPPSFHIVMDIQANDIDDGFYVRVPTNPSTSSIPDKTVFSVKADGNVGINTSSPSATLDVVGPTELNGDVDINSDLNVDNGSLDVNGVSLGINVAHGGLLETYQADGDVAVRLTTTTGAGAAHGVLETYQADGDVAVRLTTNEVGGGFLATYLADGNEAIQLNTTSANTGGLLGVKDAAGTSTIQLDGATGQICRVSECTLTLSPLLAGKEIHYGVLEGAEDGVYLRGTAQLVGGQATIELPNHFAIVAADQGLTVQLTPLSADSEGLAVVSKSTRQVMVRELRRGTGTYEFDYYVSAVKRGSEDFQVIRDPAMREALPDQALPARPRNDQNRN